MGPIGLPGEGFRDAPDFNFLDEREFYSVMADAYRELLKEIGQDHETADFEASWGPLRLDYIFGSGEIEIVNGGRITYESTPYPSGHYPIIADVRVPPGKQEARAVV